MNLLYHAFALLIAGVFVLGVMYLLGFLVFVGMARELESLGYPCEEARRLAGTFLFGPRSKDRRHRERGDG